MGYEIETIEYKGHTIKIEQDDNPQNPRTEQDNVCVFHVGHSSYNFGDENYNDRESIDKAFHKAVAAGDVVMPLYIYDHSGITISTSPFACRWDSGQVGFVQVPRKEFVAEFGKKYFTKKLKELAEKWIQSETNILDQYIRGDVCGYIIDEDGDSCWGYFGEEYAIEEAKGVVDYMVKEAKKSHFEQLKIWIKNKVPFYARQTFAVALEV